MLALLAGLICDESIFASQLRAFPEARAFAGYDGCDSLKAMAHYVLDRAEPQFDLLGHSMGGRIALEIMRIAPERVRRLALVSTGTHGVRPGEADKRAALAQLGREQGFGALVDAWLPPMVGPAGQNDPQIMAALRTMCMAQGQETFERHIRALLGRRDATDLLPAISVPTLVMTGEDDSWSPPEQHEAMAAATPASTLVIVPGAGHMITLESPDAVNRAIANWLSRN